MNGPTVTADATAWVHGGGERRVERIALHYDPADPLAVELTFRGRVEGDEALTWVFARDLLADGLAEPSGRSDVRVSAVGEVVFVTIDSPDGLAVVELRAAWVALFMRRAYRLVPRGGELLDVDAAVAALLGGRRA